MAQQEEKTTKECAPRGRGVVRELLFPFLASRWGATEAEALCAAVEERRVLGLHPENRDFLEGLAVGVAAWETFRQSMLSAENLAGVLPREYFLECAEREFRRAERHGVPLALLLLDLDHFKRVNAQCGREVGDAVLQHVMGLWRQCVRTEDLLGRLEGEEFAALLPETDLEGALTLAKRLQDVVAEHPWVAAENPSVPARFSLPDGGVVVTVSAGVAGRREGDPCFQAMLERSSRALARSLRRGPNRVEILGD